MTASDITIAVLTLVLVATTIYYAFQTRRMVEEMQTDRAEAARVRREDRELAHLEACRSALKDVTDRAWRNQLRPGPTEYAALRRTLDDHAPFVDDDQVRDHLEAAAQVAFVASFDDGALDTERWIVAYSTSMPTTCFERR